MNLFGDVRFIPGLGLIISVLNRDNDENPKKKSQFTNKILNYVYILFYHLSIKSISKY